MNEYIRETIGPEFTSKHFRTWGAIVLATLDLAREPLPASMRTRVAVLRWLEMQDGRGGSRSAG